ncbi:MAG: 3-hydroxyacyl-CoA dehydrogenase NAD-binding domain-containing protein [Pseudomonadota bacterium]
MSGSPNTDVVRYETDGEVAVLTVQSPPVNALSVHVRSGIKTGVERALSDDGVRAIALVCDGRTFIAGADITEFGKPPMAPSLGEVHDVMEGAPKPLVAGIHGTALGGGLETAFACHYRVAVPSAKVGLPEVKLGIVPGAGGTQRLPRLVGVEKAIDMIAGGDPIGAAKAAELGVIDKVVDGDLHAATIAFAKDLLSSNAELVKVRDRGEKIADIAPDVFETARKNWGRKKRGFEAPQGCIDAIEAACTLPFDEGMQKEREIITRLMAGDQSLAQRHFFFAERQANKIPDVPRDTPMRDIRTAAVLGAGTMGGGIAMNFANAGIPVTIVEREQEALDRGLGIIRKNYENTAKKGRLTQEQVEQRMACLTGSLDFDTAVSDVDIVIEAVFENMDLKKEIFSRLDANCKPGCILASNTSTLDLDEIAAVTKRPEDVIGLHFFSPANVMRLLEEVRGEKTSAEVIATCMALAKRIGKVPVLVGVCHGFVGNRMLHSYFDQAFSLLYEGCQPEDVDGALYAHGLAMGPFAMSDLAGLDVSWRIRQETGEKNPIADRLCELGRFGQKTGAGYYRYEPGNRTPIPDDVTAKIVEEEGVRKHNHRRDIGDEEIVERCMLALVNEGARILEEGKAMRASDIDVIYLTGYGYPIYRGGPMFWADLMGLDKVLAKIKGFHAAGYGDQTWEPAPLIEQLVAEGKSFKDFDKQ